MKSSGNINSFNSDDDDKSYIELNEFLINDLNRKKSKTILDVELMGEKLLHEIDLKKSNKKNIRDSQIKYIIKNCNNKYDLSVIESYDYNDIAVIYNEIKNNKKSKFVEMFKFIFNIQ